MSLSRIPPQAFSCGSGTRVLKRGRTLSFILAALLLFSACAEAVASDATVTAGALVPVFARGGRRAGKRIRAGRAAGSRGRPRGAGRGYAGIRADRRHGERPVSGAGRGRVRRAVSGAEGNLRDDRLHRLRRRGGQKRVAARRRAVTLSCTRDATHIGAGVLLSVDGSIFSVLPTAGEFYVGEAVNVYAETESGTARIGRATVARAEPVSVTGEGTVTRLLVSDGARVMKDRRCLRSVSSRSGTPETIARRTA